MNSIKKNMKKKANIKLKTKNESQENEIDLTILDTRFRHIHADPRFKNAPSIQRKIKLDERFGKILKNDLFSEKASMDPRGRPRNFGSKENFNRLYEISTSGSEDSDNNDYKEGTEGVENRLFDKKLKKKVKKLAYRDGSDAERENKSIKVCKKKIVKEISDSNTIEGQDYKTKMIKKCTVKNLNKDMKKNISINKVYLSRPNNETGNIAKNEMLSTANIPDILLERLQDMSQDVTRGGLQFSDDSSDDDSSTTDDDDNEEFGLFEWGELDHDAKWDCEEDVEESSRFAVCNMDWDQVKAIDLLVLFTSFVPIGGKVEKVTIYLSEFGKQRLAEEDEKGPPELANLESSKRQIDSDIQYLDKISKGTLNESTQPTANYTEALRRYQRNRLKYYYAVVDCDSLDTAKVIYQECDRLPYEVAGVTLDLRYIPTDMEFDKEVAHDCCSTLPVKYESEVFQTTALLDSNPTLTWDETDRARKKTMSSTMMKAMQKQNYDFDKLQNYVADSSSEEEVEEKSLSDGDEEMNKESKLERIAKFRAIMDELEGKENKKTNLEIDKEEAFEIEEKPTIEEVEETDNVDKENKKLTPFEKYLVKRIEKRKGKTKEVEIQFSDDELPVDIKEISSDPFFALEMKKTKKSKRNKKKGAENVDQSTKEPEHGELNLMLMEEEEEDVKHFNMRNILEADTEQTKRQGKRKKANKFDQLKENMNDFKIDLCDPRFSAIAKSRDFNIDPSHPQFVATKAMGKLAKEVQERRRSSITYDQVGNKRSQLGDDVSRLVKRVKLKTKGKYTVQ